VKTSDLYIIPFTGLAAGMHSFSWDCDEKFFEADNYLEISDASIMVGCTLQKSMKSSLKQTIIWKSAMQALW